MQTHILDDFVDLSGWGVVASGLARLELVPDIAPSGKSMRLDFDFGSGGGFVVARRLCALALPQSFDVLLRVRAAAPANAFEFKLVDPSGANVWRFRDESFDFASDWRELRINSRMIDFGWGPAGGGAPSEIGALEIVVAAGPGGRGSLWMSDLRLVDRTPSVAPLVTASSVRAGQDAECVLDGRLGTCWRPEEYPAWIGLDFGEPRDYGGLILRWTGGRRGGFRVLAGEDGLNWTCLYQAPRACGSRNYVYLPDGCSRHLRLELPEGDSGLASGLVALEVQSESFARTRNDFFHRLAEDAPPGRYPRWLGRRQSYWTPVDVPDGTVPALFNEEGMVEIRRAGYSVEPFLFRDGRLVTWADCEITQELLEPPLPIPRSVWMYGDLMLTVTAYANTMAGGRRLTLRYALTSWADRPTAVTLFVAIRPFQVSPPWQGYRDIGGVSPIRELDYRDGAVWIDGELALVPLDTPSGFGAAAFDEGSIVDHLAAGGLSASRVVQDPFGYASGALTFALTIEPRGTRVVEVAAPLGEVEPRAALDWAAALGRGADRLGEARSQWAVMLGAVDFQLPAVAQPYADACKGALAHILINRDGPALQPGPRRYTRSWIRDGAVMAAALLRLGRSPEAADFVRWYARFQAADGNVPCCVDRDGCDWLPEHDSHGQLIFAVADYYRFTRDAGLVEELWPAVLKAVEYLECLRAQRLTSEFLSPELRACYGLLTESVSHEGYLAHPVHAYWDDFWALRGLKDAVELADVMGDAAQSARLAALRDDFADTLHASIRRTIEQRGIDFIPGSVEWADPDPTATAVALTLVDESHRLPPVQMQRGFDLFMERFRAMHGESPVPWTNYTPYEIRIIGALLRLDRREEAHELARFYLAERRPPVWNQWPEIAWRDPRAPGHQGDLPHAWIGAEYCLVFRDMFAFERESDRSLVVGGGIPAQWLDAGAVEVTGLPTAYGRLDLALSRLPGGGVRVRLGGDLIPPAGGLRLALPIAGAVRTVRVDGRPSGAFTGREVQVSVIPAEIEVAS